MQIKFLKSGHTRLINIEEAFYGEHPSAQPFAKKQAMAKQRMQQRGNKSAVATRRTDTDADDTSDDEDSRVSGYYNRPRRQLTLHLSLFQNS